MTRAMLALGSFAVGVMTTSALFLLGNEASIRAQEAPTPPPVRWALKTEGADPVVPPLRNTIGAGSFNGAVTLDGLSCTDCTFSNVTFVYAGGSYTLARPKFNGTISLLPTGAAANTLQIVQFLTAQGSGNPHQLPKPNQKHDRTVTAKLEQIDSLLSPTVRQPE